MRGGSPVTVPVWATRHGPVVHGNPDAGTALVLKWTGTHRPNRGFECLLPMLTARTAAELADAQDGWVDPVNNLVCADTRGQIAYQCRGELPVRSSDGARRLPVPGWDDACEWTGTVPFAVAAAGRRPRGRVRDDRQQRDHRRGRAVYLVHVLPAVAGRAAPLAARRHSGALSAGELAGMQADTVSLQARGWGRLLAGLGPFDDEDAEAARAMLAGLGRRPGRGVGGGAAVRVLPASARRGAVPAGARREDVGVDGVGRARADAVHDAALARQRHLGDARRTGAAGQEGREAASVRGRRRVLAAVPGALAAAVGGGGQGRRPDPPQWRWGDVHRAARCTRSPAAGFPGAPMGGDADTVQASGYGWRPGSPFTVTALSVYRQVVDLADPASASFVIPGGASGDPASAHFSDQLALWADHRRIGMQGS